MAEHGEALGFAGCVASEHHSREDGYIPSPLALCAAVAARTRTIEASTGVMLLPLWSPIRVAEDCALIDIISGGRFALGAGLGLVAREFELYEIPLDSAVGRFEEAVEILRRAWTGEPFSFDGRALPPARRPRHPAADAPVDDPDRRDERPRDPPGGPDRRRLADRSAPRARDDADSGRAVPGGGGRTPGGRPRVHLMRDCWIPAATSDLYREWGGSSRTTGATTSSSARFAGRFNPAAEPWLREITSAPELTFERLRRDRIICGTAERVRDEIARWIEAIRPDRFNLRFRLPYGPAARAGPRGDGGLRARGDAGVQRRRAGLTTGR